MFLKKGTNFYAQFSSILAKFELLRHILTKIHDQDRSFKPKKSVPRDSTFENPGSTYLPKII